MTETNATPEFTPEPTCPECGLYPLETGLCPKCGEYVDVEGDR